ncbi:MAG TPA: M4 family metallopeptidase [Geothrix sp.]|nr:M4 family metallopeptidase [Geothrix sp.]
MHGTLPHPLTGLVLTLALGVLPASARTLPPAARPAQQAQQANRVELAREYLMQQRTALGLGSREAFVPAKAFTNAEGEAVVRFDQTYEGCRVLGSQAIATVPMTGGMRIAADKVRAQVAVADAPTLTPEQATAIALHHLAPKGALADAPKVERVVFPAEFLGNLATTVDPDTGRQVLDRKLTVHAKLAAPYVWAYEVKTHLKNDQDGPKALTYFIDARTGNLLRVNNELYQEATPAVGTGNGYYNGAVSIPTSLMNDGTYALYDPSRGILPNPSLAGFADDGSGWGPTGLQVWYDQHDASGASTWMTYLFQSNPTNTWGDGQVFTAWGQENGANGQSAGVDAMYGITQTWDMFNHVFGRNGMDGQGTSVFAQVLSTNPYYVDNAYWSDWEQGLYLGAGTYPANPNGMNSLNELDVVAHEMTHGVTASTVKFITGAGYEEAGLNEATSDFFGQMAKAYAARATGADDAIPESGEAWRVGFKTGHGTPIRWLDKPSKDHRSVDGWYDGLYYMDGHYSAGVLNRALYFLAHGASATPGADDYSPYLPQGMTGIGNDKAAHIWFKAVTEILYSGNMGTVTYADAREAARQAALSLYGASADGWGLDSIASHAVENAFAAVNVGLAYGEMSRTQVRFADWRGQDWISRHHFSDTGYGHKQYFPMGEAVSPRVTVLNNANPAVTWSLGGPSLYNGATYVEKGGVINPDGTWTTPKNVGWFAITATSKADPNQFAEGRAFIINMDTDTDLEQDAIDLGPIAFSWQLTNGLNPAHSMYNAPWVDDADVAAFVDAMKSTWWNK